MTNQPSKKTLRAALTLGLVLSATALSSATLLGQNASAEDLVPLTLKLPAPIFEGTPKNIPVGSTVEPLSNKPRPPFLAPKNVRNLALNKKVTSSDASATPGTLQKITDGIKEATENSAALVRKGTQYVQIDLGETSELFALVLWHAHDSPKVYHDVIVQIADDADFIDNVRTLFNNDQDNSSGQGLGADREYFETYQGKLIDAKGAKARYLRFYSKGSTESTLNEYTEIEAYGRPAK